MCEALKRRYFAESCEVGKGSLMDLQWREVVYAQIEIGLDSGIFPPVYK